MKSIHRVVAACAAVLFSFASAAHAGDTLAPGLPEELGAISRTCNSIDLTWSGGYEPEADEAQSGLARFEIRSLANDTPAFLGPGNSGTAPWSYLRTASGRPLRYTRIVGLAPGATYRFSARAIDHAGNRSSAALFPPATVLASGAACSDVTPPSVPDISASTFTTQGCHSLFGPIAPSTDVGSGVEGYFVYVDNARAGFTTDGFAFLPPLTPGRKYRLSLQAVDRAGNASAVSAAKSLTMPACAPLVSGNLNVYAQGFYFKGEPVPAYDRLTSMQNVLHDFDGTNVANPKNVDRYLRDSSYGVLGLRKPYILTPWTQLPRTAAEYGCARIDGLFGNCDFAAIATDAIDAHPQKLLLADAFPLRTYFVDGMRGFLHSTTGRAFVVTGITADLERTSIEAAGLIRTSLTRLSSNVVPLYCPGPGTGSSSGAGNVASYSQDLSFGCYHGATDFSVSPDTESRRLPHPPALWKYWLGWLPEAQTRRVTLPWYGVIGATELESTSAKLLMVPVGPIGTSGNANVPFYTLEFIGGYGLNAGQTRGLAIREYGNVLPQSQANVVKSIDTLQSEGEYFVDPYRGIRIELIRAIGAAALVRACNTRPGVAADGSFSSECVN